MSRGLTRAVLAASGLVMAVAAVLVVMVVPARTHWAVSIETSGANEVVLPVGYWALVALWMLIAGQLTQVTPRLVVTRAVEVGLFVHALLLLALFAPRLADPAAFSAAPYWWYARLFCAAALAAAIWWAGRAIRTFGHSAHDLGMLDAPVIVGAAVLFVGLARYDPAMAAAGAAAGVAGALVPWPRATRSPAFVVIRQTLSDERMFVLAVFLLALGLRVLYLRRVMSNPNYLETGADGPVYDELAWSIASGHGIRASFTNRFPLLLLGYVWFMSAVYFVAGHSYFILGVVQGVLGALACVVLYSVARDLFGAAVARVAMVFAAINFPLLFAAAAIGHQAVDVFLILLIVWMLMRATKAMHTSRWRWAGIGAVLGLAIAVRETNVFLLGFLVLWMPFAFKRRGWTGSLPAAAALTAGVAVVLGPLVVPMVATSEKRAGLRVHFDRLYRGDADVGPIRTGIVGPLTAPAAAAQQLIDEPRLVIGTLVHAYAKNIGLQFFSQPYGGFDLVFLSKGSQYYYGVWFYAYAFAIAGMILAIRRIRAGGPNAAGLVLVLGVVVSRTLPHLFLESNFRHRAAIEPFLILLTAGAAVGLAQSIRSRWQPELAA
jgi:hypothetical protein